MKLKFLVRLDAEWLSIPTNIKKNMTVEMRD